MKGAVGEPEERKEEPEIHAINIPGPGSAAQGNGSSLDTVQKVQPRLTRVLLAKRASQLVENLRTQATTVPGTQAFVRYMGAHRKGAVAWVACQSTTPNEAMGPDLSLETLARGSGSHDNDRLLGVRCHACENGRPSPNHSLICSRAGMRWHTHPVLLQKIFVNGASEVGCHV